jgi:hypothetical protein
MASQGVILIGVLLVALIAGIVIASSPHQGVVQQTPTVVELAPAAPTLPTTLSFTVDLPDLTPSVVTVVTVHINSENGDAKSVTLKTDSAVLQLDNSSIDVKSGAPADLKLSAIAADVQDGACTAKFWLHYLDSMRAKDSSAKQISFYILPHVVIQKPNWALDWWAPDWSQPLGKSKISESDSTVARFVVASESKSITYQGIIAKASLEISGLGLAIQAPSMQIDPIGPQGQSHEYSFTITSNNTPPGEYTLLIQLFSKDGQLITQNAIQFQVS